MTRVFALVAVIGLVACESTKNAPTLNGNPIIRGGDPNAVYDTIDLPDLPSVILTSENGKVGLGVFQAKTGIPYLSVGDADNDGAFDFLTYSSLSVDGELLVEVEDYGMDGQPDFILNYRESSASVFYNGTWLAVTGIGPGGEPPTVDIDGDIRPLDEVLVEIGRRPF